MRELKFRVWQKATHQYRHFVLQKGVSVNIGADLEIEQYTGLKDKNGKEICIGDVVSEHHGDIIGEIVQKPSGEYRIAWIGIFGGESVLYDHRSLCEVIGNIHENPELLRRAE